MNFSFEDIIRVFWIDYHKATEVSAYEMLLIQAKLNCMELMETLKGEEFLTFYDNSPLLAMISEVHRVCPEAVHNLAKNDSFFVVALNLFSSYSEEKRDLLRDTFLLKPNTLYRLK